MQDSFNVVVIGAGPAGLAGAIAAREAGGEVLVIEREKRLGGILKQCIHDGFGLNRYGERLTGPEYAYRDIKKAEELGITFLTSAFVLDVKKHDGFSLAVSTREGIRKIRAKALILATGCRERTAKQIFIHGKRPSGIFTAGCAQYLVNIEGLLPGRRCVILGSGDIGLIMARRLTLEGCEVVGVYEAKKTPSGLKRNISQCLNDFHIPLHLKKTVTRVFGEDRLEGVEIASVDDDMNVIKGTEERVACDTLILSVGLIPENELAEKLGVEISPFTKGAVVDNNLETSVAGVFAAGNALSVNDLVEYVSENGFIAGKAAMDYIKGRKPRAFLAVERGAGIASVVPQRLDVNSDLSKVVFYIRSDGDHRERKLLLKKGEEILFQKGFKVMNQAESIRIKADLSGLDGDIRVEIA